MTFARALLPLLFGLPLLPASAAPQQEHYRVQPGDTLIGVSERLLRPEIRWQQLQRLNRVSNPLRLRPGSELRFPSDWLRERATQAELLQLNGEIWRLRGGQREALQAGALLQEGDRLISGPQSSATLRFADGTRSLLRPASELSLLQLRTLAAGSARSRVELLQGGLETQVPPATAARSNPLRFELRSPVANLGVRGTQFRAQLQGGALGLEVLEGRVAALPQGARAAEVGGGQGWHSRSGIEPLLPAPQLAAPAPVERLPLQLQWAAQAGAQGWRLQWFDAEGGLLLLEAETASPQFIGAAELPDGDYRLRLRARSASGLEGRDLELPLRIAARPEPPVLSAPPPQAEVYAAGLDFAWTRPAAAQRYRFQFAADTHFSAPAQDLLLDEPQLRLELPEGEGHWRVASVNAQGKQGPWSDAQHLRRLPPPPSPPPAEPQRDGDQLQLRWAQSPLTGARYQVQVASTPDFNQPWVDETVDSPQLQLHLQQRGPQQLRIRTLAPDGTPGPWGATQQLDGLPQRPWWLLLLLLPVAL